jgi:hypothetical protein
MGTNGRPGNSRDDPAHRADLVHARCGALIEAKHSVHLNRLGILKEQEVPELAEGEMDDKNLERYKIARSGLMRQSLRQAVALAAALSLVLAPVKRCSRSK